MRKLFISGMSLNLLILIVNFATGVLSARYLGPIGRGDLAFTIRWVGVFIGLLTFGTPGALVYLIMNNRHAQRDYLGAFVIIGLTIGITGWALLELFIPEIFHTIPSQVVHFLRIYLLALPFLMFSDGLLGTLQSLEMYHGLLLMRFLSPIGNLIGIVFLLLLHSFSVLHYLWVLVIMSSILVFIPLMFIFSELRPRFKLSGRHIRTLMSVSIKAYTASLTALFGGNLDQILLSLLLPTYVLGLYAVAASITSIIPSIIINSIRIFSNSRLVKQSPGEREKIAARFYSTTFYLSLVLSVFAMCIFPYLFKFIYGRSYVEAIPMAEILFLSGPFNVAYAILSDYVSSYGKFKFVTLSEVVGLILAITTISAFSSATPLICTPLGVFVASISKWGVLSMMSWKLGLSKVDPFRPNIKELLSVMRSAQGKLFGFYVSNGD